MSDTRSRDPIAERPAPQRAAEARGRSAFNFDEPRDDESIGQLLRRLASQGSHLAEQQAELARAELRSSIADLKQAAGAMAGAAVIGMAGLGVTLMGVAFLLAEAIGLWPATIVVGLAALIGAYALYASATEKLKSQSMSIERTRSTLERAPEAISGNEKDPLHD